MREQIVQNRQPRWWEGILIVLAIALLVLVGNGVFSMLALRIGRLASLLFLIYGFAVAWLLQFWFVMRFIYTANNDALRVCRLYGKRERFMTDVWFKAVVAWGTPEEVRARCPHARVSRATRRQCGLAPFALAYKDDGKLAMLILQPDEAMKAHLVSRLKK